MPWKLQTRDGLELFDPEGRPVALPYRKVGELVVYLAACPDRIAPRDEVAAALWPTADRETRQSNLRQALTKLRTVIGGDSVLSTRDKCGLAADFSLEVVGASPEPDAWVLGWVQFLQRLAEHAPVQMFETLRVNAELAIDLPAADLSRLTETAICRLPADHRQTGWISYWQAWCSLNRVPVASDLFSQALQWAATERDSELIGRSAYWLGACEILQGRVQVAMDLADSAHAYLRPKGSPISQTLASLKGTALLHAGRNREALTLLQGLSAHTAISHPEYAQNEALRAFYLATVGLSDQALAVLESMPNSDDQPSLSRVNILRSLTQATVESSRRPETLLTDFEEKVHSFGSVGQAHFELYGHETLAVAHYRCRNKVEAREHLKTSRLLRKKLNIVYTAWDRRRLSPLNHES